MEQAHLQNRWLDLASDEWTPGIADELLSKLSDDSDSDGGEWIVRAVLATRPEDAQVELVLLDAALRASDRVLVGEEVAALKALMAAGAGEAGRGGQEEEVVEQRLRVSLQDKPDLIEAIQSRRTLLELKDKTRTWQELYRTNSTPSASSSPRADAQTPQTNAAEHESDDSMDDDEPSWQFEDEDEDVDAVVNDGADLDDQINDMAQSPSTQRDGLGHSLPDFLDTPILQLAMQAAAQAEFTVLRKLFDRHPDNLKRHRLALLDLIPTTADVTEYIELLPKVELQGEAEVAQAHPGNPWRSQGDWSEHAVVSTALGIADSTGSKRAAATSAELGEWYKARVSAIEDTTGQLDHALTLIQYGASQGIPGLDAIGEELSLLSRLVYDTGKATDADDRDEGTVHHGPGSRTESAHEWTFKWWSTSSTTEIVQAYLCQSTVTTIADDIRRLVLPYLYVVESQLERSGQPDPTLHERKLVEWILQTSASNLQLVASIFQTSKPTLSYAQRLIKSDEQLARLAIACLYSHGSMLAWDTMTSIFDCLPAFGEQSEAQTISPSHTLSSLFSSSPASNPPSASQLYEALLEFPVSALSQALDAFDLHLEAAEIFARWSSPMPLRFFVSLTDDIKLQRSWADRLAKTSAAAVSNQTGDRLGKDFEFEDEWISLLDDLCRLAGKDEYAQNEPKPAFGLLTKQEITKIFFSGLLSSGKFDLARSLFSPSTGERPLDTRAEQELVLAASREFYDNAESGNIHEGNMKLAFECLSVAPTTPDIRRERDFIEATSRLTSFRISNQAGQPLTPIEIRLTQDKLSLIARLLSSNEDAYRHPEVILDLVAKLGYRGDPLAETRVLCMLADAALQAGDAKRAGDVCDRMVKAVEGIRKGKNRDMADQASDLAWRTCFQFGRHEDVKDTDKRKDLLGRALLLCPPANMPDVLSVWQVIDSAVVYQHKRTPSKDLAHKKASTMTPSQSRSSSNTTGGGLHLPSLHIPSRTGTPSLHLPHSAEEAARAALSVGRAASAYLPFRQTTPDPSTNSSQRSASPLRSSGPWDRDDAARLAASGSSEADRVREAISNRVAAGVSWLIGADEQ